MSFESLSPSPQLPVLGEHQVLNVLIFARDEADVLPASLASLAPQLASGDRLTVVADHCRDSTASVARATGAEVRLRQIGPPGKGHALRWWLDQTRRSSCRDDVVLVLDADSRARPGFLSAMRRQLTPAQPVVQAMLEQTTHSVGGAGALASLSEFMEQHVSDRLRSLLGWPVRLRGTGMAFRRGVLEDVAQALETSVEDSELTVLLGAAGVPIGLAQEARVLDAKPETDLAAVRQRARWLKGQAHLVRRHPGALLSLMLQGPKGWFLLSSVLLKPRSLTVLARGGLWIALRFDATALGIAGILLQWIIVLSLVVDFSVLLVAIGLSSDRGTVLRTAVRLPAFLVIWLRSLHLAVRSRESWLRARPLAHEKNLTSPDPAST